MKDIVRRNYFASRWSLLNKRDSMARRYTSAKALGDVYGEAPNHRYLQGRIDGLDNDIMLVESLLLGGGATLTRTERFFK